MRQGALAAPACVIRSARARARTAGLHLGLLRLLPDLGGRKVLDMVDGEDDGAHERLHVRLQGDQVGHALEVHRRVPIVGMRGTVAV
jgi:hypothetical protein